MSNTCESQQNGSADKNRSVLLWGGHRSRLLGHGLKSTESLYQLVVDYTECSGSQYSPLTLPQGEFLSTNTMFWVGTSVNKNS